MFDPQVNYRLLHAATNRLDFEECDRLLAEREAWAADQLAKARALRAANRKMRDTAMEQKS